MNSIMFRTDRAPFQGNECVGVWPKRMDAYEDVLPQGKRAAVAVVRRVLSDCSHRQKSS